jgi:hypothetical protein
VAAVTSAAVGAVIETEEALISLALIVLGMLVAMIATAIRGWMSLVVPEVFTIVMIVRKGLAVYLAHDNTYSV